LNVAESIATITLNRPEKRNALDARTVAELDEAVRYCAEMDDVRVIALRGEGPDFCAGADIQQLARMAETTDSLENLDDAQALGALFVLMRRTEKPIVAAVHGNAIAGGAGLASACDLIVASDDATFGYPEVHLGFVPAMVTALLRRSLGEKQIFELIALGNRFSAAEAYEIGLVARVFPAAQFDQLTRAFLAELASRSASALRLCKRLLYGIDQLPFEDGIARGAEINVIARATPDCQQGLRRFLEKNR
jgi:methylglutaconyl-CoA hydratase